MREIVSTRDAWKAQNFYVNSWRWKFKCVNALNYLFFVLFPYFSLNAWMREDESAWFFDSEKKKNIFQNFTSLF